MSFIVVDSFVLVKTVNYKPQETYAMFGLKEWNNFLVSQVHIWLGMVVVGGVIG